MTYATEFPAMADDNACAVMAAREHWEDTSWHNDACPSFTCDVFVLWCDHADPSKRECDNVCPPRFTMVDEGCEVLMTDDFADVVAFMDIGKRDFPQYGGWGRLQGLVDAFKHWCVTQNIGPDEGDAQELLMVDRTSAQRAWLQAFIDLWDLTTAMPDMPYAPEEDAALKEAWDNA